MDKKTACEQSRAVFLSRSSGEAIAKRWQSVAAPRTLGHEIKICQIDFLQGCSLNIQAFIWNIPLLDTRTTGALRYCFAIALRPYRNLLFAIFNLQLRLAWSHANLCHSPRKVGHNYAVCPGNKIIKYRCC